MSRAPWVVAKPERPYERSNQEMHSTTLGWRFVNDRHPGQWTVPLGEGAEILADRYLISRPVQDAFAMRSHHRAAGAWAAGRFDAEVVAPYGAALERDETVRPGTSLDSLARLRPAFRPGGTVTAGNSSPMSDGAAAVLLGTEGAASSIGVEPLARIVSRAVSAVEPHLYGIGPVTAARAALDRAGIGWGDLAAVELNEAFAAQSLAVISELGVDADRVNPLGGAIALGHPLGCSGARIATTLVHQLHALGPGTRGAATMCIGVGQGIASLFEAV
jgi:acetyl-CoA acetyltransferase family protein